MTPRYYLFVVAVIFMHVGGGTLSQASEVSDEDDQNAAFDKILAGVNSKIASVDLASYPIGNYDFFIVTATNGYLSNLTTFHRVGNATVTTTSNESGNTTTIEGSITATLLQAQFDDFQLGFILSIDLGQTTITIDSNLIDLKIEYSLNSNNVCTATISQFSLTTLTGYSVSFASFTVFGWLLQWVAPTVMDALSSFLMDLFNHDAQLIAQGVLNAVDICSA